MSSEDEAAHAMKIAENIYPLLAGHAPMVQGAVLADLVAMFLAGHIGPDASGLRELLLAEHIATVRKLIPVNEKIILERHRGSAN